MTRMTRIERIPNTFILTTLTLYVICLLNETAGQYLV